MELDVALRMVENINVVALDPHSEVTSLLPHIPQREVVDYYEKRVLSPDMWIIPDVGASKKAHTWVDRDYRQCLKHRDMRTGQLSGFEVLGADLRGASCVIVDDICDGGGTFLGLADKLRDKGAGDLHLLVSHGLFTNGVSKLREKFDTITHVGRPFVNTQNIPYREIYSERKIV
jgi:ribose-phosphate pyrophosphokinase